MAGTRADWQHIPTEVLTKQRRDEEAKSWADSQRKILSQSWADAQMRDLEASYPQMQQQPEPQYAAPQQSGGEAMTKFRDLYNEIGGFQPQEAPVEMPAMPSPMGMPAPRPDEGIGDLGKAFTQQPVEAPPDLSVPPMNDQITNTSTEPELKDQVFNTPRWAGATIDPNVQPTPEAVERDAEFGQGIAALPGRAADAVSGAIEGQMMETLKLDANRRNAYREYLDTKSPEALDRYVVAAGASAETLFGVGGSLALRKAAKVVGPATAKSIKLTAEEQAKRLRLDKFPEAVRDTIQKAAEFGDYWHPQRRGVIPDAVANQMADDLGRSVDEMIAKGKAGKAYNTEETRALRNALVSQSLKVNDLADQITTSGTHAVTDQMLAKQLAEGARLVDLSRIAEGARAEAGRTLRSYQAFARDFAADPANATQRIVKSVGGRDAAIEAVQEYTKLVQSGASPFQMANFWARIEKPPPGFTDWFALLRYNSMLSGPRTIEINVLGNTSEIPWRLARDTVASTLRGAPREMGPEISGMIEGAKKGIGSFMDVLTHGLTLEQAAANQLPTSISARVKNPVSKGIAKALELPLNLQAAADEFGRQTAYGMGIGRWAAVKATKEGHKGQAWGARVEELLANPTKAAMEGADAIAQRMTYKGDMGSLGQGLEGFREKTGVYGNIVLPFLRTVYHITSRGIDRSPLGAAGTLWDVGAGKYGPRTMSNLAEQVGKSGTEGLAKGMVPLGERFGDNVMGTVVTFAAMSLAAANGYITGSGPEDREKRDMMKAQGWQPYSLKIGDNWVSYSNWGPMAVPLAGAAATAEGASFADGVKRTTEVLTEQAYLQGIGAVYKALTEPDRYGEKWLSGALQTLIPYGAAINTVGQATDPMMRDPGKGTVQQIATGEVPTSIKARIPGVRESLPVAQDQLGRDVKNPLHGAAAVQPLRISKSEPDASLQVLSRYGVDVPEPPTSVRSIPLTPEEKRAFNKKAGALIQSRITKAMESDRWESRSESARKGLLERAVEDARESAGNEVIKSIGAADLKKRRETVNAAKQAVPAR